MVACPTCGGELEYIAQYDRYYCYSCKKYAPKDTAKVSAPTSSDTIPCPSCGKDLTFIPEYDRYYCYNCNKYAPKGTEKQEAKPAPAAEKPCPICGKPLTFVEVYNRWYCQSCKKYAPKEDVAQKVEAQPIPVSMPVQEPVVEKPAEFPPAAVAPTTAKIEEAAPEKPKEEIPPAAATEQPAQTPAESAPSSPRPEPGEPPSDRPTLEKKAVETGKKSYLVNLCQAYGLDSSGNRSVLKQRLLDYMVAQGLIPKEEEEEEGVQPEIAPLAAEKPPEAVVEAKPLEEIKPPVQPTAEKPPEVPVEAKPPEEVKPAEIAAEKPGEIPVTAKPPVESMPAEAAVAVPVAEKPPEAAPTAAPPTLEPLAPEAEAPPKLLIVKAISPCPTCGRELTFIKTYNRHYCYNCRKYAPEDLKPGIAKPAAPAKPVAPPAKPAVAAKPEAKKCPTCGGSLSFIRQYNKWYCYACKKYAPEKPVRNCPTCGGELDYVPQYDRYYCYNCKKYPTERGVAAVPAATVVQVTRVEKAAAREHAHGGIWAGVGLAIAALVMFILLQMIFYVPGLLGINVMTVPYPLEMTFLFQFLFGLFLILAVIAGLVGARRKEAKK